MEIDRPIAIAIILFVIFAFGFYIIIPKYREFKDVQLKLSQKEAELRGKNKYFSDIAKTYKKLKENEANLKKIESALPSEPSLSSLIYFFQEKSYENGLIFQGANLSFTKTSPVVKGGEIKETFVYLDLFGSYFSFRNFLSALEKSARLIEVENISVSVQKEDTEIYPFKLMIKVYSY